MDNEFLGKIGRTVSESTPHWPARNADSEQPNIVTVLLDDTGWADFGCFGSEIRTPTIDALAREGLRYTNFHVAPMCSPTRASFMTGRNHHAVGMRSLADTDTGFPSGRGSIPADIPLLSDRLRRQGYGTYMVGKWHLAPAHEVTPAGPFANWPVNRGFDRFYGFLSGCTDQYAPELIQDNHTIDPPIRDGYHLSEDLCDRAIQYLRDHRSFRGSDPVYLNICFGATHAPIQVEKSYIDPYVEVFEKGWDQTREDRLQRQKDLSIVPQDTVLAPRNSGVPAWDTLSDDQKRLYTRLQAAYAGFLEHTDRQLGRVVAELERLGIRDNTIIMIFSDNGASREGGADGAVDVNAPYSGRPQSVAEMIVRLDEIGGPNGPAHYPEGWAMAGSTPFRRYKQDVELGGVRSPLVVNWPRQVSDQGGVRDQFLHVIDIAPTLMNAVDGEVDPAFDGRDFAGTFDSAVSPSPRNVQYWEMFGRRAVYADGWKAVAAHEKGENYDEDRWALYDTRKDFSECTDLAHVEKERLEALKQAWTQQADANDVWPLDDRTLVDILKFRQPNGLMARECITLYPGTGHVPQVSMVTATERSMEICAHFTDAIGGAHPGGVLLSSGDGHGGYSFYIQGGHLHFEHVRIGQRAKVSAPLPDSFGRCSVVLHVHEDSTATAILFVDRVRLASCSIPLVSLHLSFWGLDVGRDAAIPVSGDYVAPFAFSEDDLAYVTLRFFEPLTAEQIAAELEANE